jgi:hypothetical protein
MLAMVALAAAMATGETQKLLYFNNDLTNTYSQESPFHQKGQVSTDRTDTPTSPQGAPSIQHFTHFCAVAIELYTLVTALHHTRLCRLAEQRYRLCFSATGAAKRRGLPLSLKLLLTSTPHPCVAFVWLCSPRMQPFSATVVEGSVSETRGIGVTTHLLSPGFGWVAWWDSKVAPPREYDAWMRATFGPHVPSNPNVTGPVRLVSHPSLLPQA